MPLKMSMKDVSELFVEDHSNYLGSKAVTKRFQSSFRALSGWFDQLTICAVLRVHTPFDDDKGDAIIVAIIVITIVC